MVVPLRVVASEGTKAADLSDRELEALALVAAGLTNQEIARRLYLTVNTVKTHLRVAYRKISVHSRSQAVAWYLSHSGSDAVRQHQERPA